MRMRVAPRTASEGTLTVPVVTVLKTRVVSSPRSVNTPLWFQSAHRYIASPLNGFVVVIGIDWLLPWLTIVDFDVKFSSAMPHVELLLIVPIDTLLMNSLPAQGVVIVGAQ